MENDEEKLIFITNYIGPIYFLNLFNGNWFKENTL